MIISEIFSRFSKNCPMPVALKATLERVLSPEKLDKWFEVNSDKQYTREILFSTLFDLMGMVVFKVFPSVNSAYRSNTESMTASLTSIYNKFNGLEPETTAALLRDTSSEMASLTRGLKAQRIPLLSGYTVKMLDGNCIEKTEHRLKVLRKTNAGPLPGKSLVVYDHSLDLAIDLFPCEDGHAQERSLLKKVLPTVKPKDVWVADRNFCVMGFLSGIELRKGFYVIRRHMNFPLELQGKMQYVGETETGKVYEQKIQIKDKDASNKRIVRFITIELNESTRDSDDVISIISNLPEDIDAVTIAEIYRNRWSIETLFQKLTSDLNSEMNTLGYPRAALFGFSLALIAYNALSIVKAAMRSVHGEEKIEQEVSGYYIAGEVSRTLEGMNVALPDEQWIVFREMSDREFIRFLKSLMKDVNLLKYKKNTRGVKKTKPKRDQHVGKKHVSTFRLLTE